MKGINTLDLIKGLEPKSDWEKALIEVANSTDLTVEEKIKVIAKACFSTYLTNRREPDELMTEFLRIKDRK